MRAEDGAQTRDPQLGRLMLYQLSYFRISNLCGQGWIRTTEGISQQIYSLPHLATLVLAHTHLSESAPFGHSGICPLAIDYKVVNTAFFNCVAKIQLFF